MDAIRLKLARALTNVPVPYRIGRANLLANIKWALIWAITPNER